MAARLARRAPRLHAGAIALLVLAGAIINLVYFAHPLWFAVTGIGMVLVAGVLAGRAATHSQAITTSTRPG